MKTLFSFFFLFFAEANTTQRLNANTLLASAQTQKQNVDTLRKELLSTQKRSRKKREASL